METLQRLNAWFFPPSPAGGAQSYAEMERQRVTRLLPVFFAASALLALALTAETGAPIPLYGVWLAGAAGLGGVLLALVHRGRLEDARRLYFMLNAALLLLGLLADDPGEMPTLCLLLLTVAIGAGGLLGGSGASPGIIGVNSAVIFVSGVVNGDLLSERTAMLTLALVVGGGLTYAVMRGYEASLRQLDLSNELTQMYSDLTAATEESLMQHEELERQRNFLDALLDGIAPDIVFVIDTRGVIQRCNDAMVQRFGWPRDDLVGASMARICADQAQWRTLRRSVLEAVRSNARARVEQEFFTRDGLPIRMEGAISWVEAERVLVIVARDVTRRYELEQDLEHALEDLAQTLTHSERVRVELETMFAAARDGLVIFDAQGRELRRNPAVGTIYGGLRLEGRHVADNAARLQFRLLDGTPVTAEMTPVARVLAGADEVAPAPFLFQRPDGSRRVLEVSAVALRNPGGELTGALGSVRDITTEYRYTLHDRLLRTLAHECSGALESRAVAKIAVHVLTDHLGLASCAVILRDDERPGFAIPVALLTANAPAVDQALRTLPIAPDAPMRSLRVLATGEPLFNIAPTQSSIDLRLSQLEDQLAHVPLRSDGGVIGCLTVGYGAREGVAWETPDQEMLLAAADEIATSLHRARLYEEAQHQAQVDPLTGLSNHRALQQTVQRELAAAAHQGIPLSVVMLDVDHFRRFNETYGHDVGDRALRVVAGAIQRAIRHSDIAARYGGEEFTVVLPAADAADAAVIAERIRAAIALARVPVEGVAEGVPITASLGFATFPAQASVPASLLKAADIALYAAKHAGRNQVMAYHPALLRGDGEDQPPPALHAHASLDAVQALIMGIDLRDGYTAAHSEAVSRLAVAIARRLGLDHETVETVRLGALMHDVGKIGIPDEILMKSGALTADEWHRMRAHTTLGEDLLRSVEQLRHLAPIVRGHHERLDGSGYPDGLRDDQIPLPVRIVAVADIFDAFTAERPYHSARSASEGLALLHAEAAAGRVDGAVVRALAAVVPSQGQPERQTALPPAA